MSTDLNESVIQKGWIVTIQHLLGLNIFAITELTIITLFCPDIKGAASDVNENLVASTASWIVKKKSTLSMDA